MYTDRPNERPGVDAGWRLLFAFSRPWSRATQAGCSPSPMRERSEPRTDALKGLQYFSPGQPRIRFGGRPGLRAPNDLLFFPSGLPRMLSGQTGRKKRGRVGWRLPRAAVPPALRSGGPRPGLFSCRPDWGSRGPKPLSGAGSISTDGRTKSLRWTPRPGCVFIAGIAGAAPVSRIVGQKRG
jgi:hypothetical protein